MSCFPQRPALGAQQSPGGPEAWTWRDSFSLHAHPLRECHEAFLRMLVPVAVLSAGAPKLPLLREMARFASTLMLQCQEISRRPEALVTKCPKAFLSNTAIVTMMIPIIVSWSRTLGVAPGKLLMPLSFADIWRNGSRM